MKKALSALLAFALALSLAVCAAAKEPITEEKPQSPPTYQEMEDKMASAVDAASLTFELPVVTSIAAVWNGTALFDYWLWPYFSPENVEITVTFDDATTQTLDYWDDGGNGWYWFISYGYNEAAGKVTFYYEDSNSWQAYRDSLADPEEDFDWDGFLATLPQTTILVGDLRQQYVDSLVKTELKLGESKKAVLTEGERKLFTFTPAKDGLYYFYSENREGGTDPFALLMDAALTPVAWNDDLFDLNFGIIVELKAGKTYYLFASGLGLGAGEFNVAMRSDMRKISVWQWLWQALSFGVFRLRWFVYGNDLYVLPSAGISNNTEFNVATASGLGRWLGMQFTKLFNFAF